MSTHTQILYHIVFATKNRKPTIEKGQKKRLYAYIFHLIKNAICIESMGWRTIFIFSPMSILLFPFQPW
jgi:REP element-mobilizing transposase RayT